MDASAHCERITLCTGDGEDDGEASTAFLEACGDEGQPCIYCEEDSGWENERWIETRNGVETDAWDPTKPGCHIVHYDLADLVSSQGTCCAGLCKQLCG